MLSHVHLVNPESRENVRTQVFAQGTQVSQQEDQQPHHSYHRNDIDQEVSVFGNKSSDSPCHASDPTESRLMFQLVCKNLVGLSSPSPRVKRNVGEGLITITGLQKQSVVSSPNHTRKI